jgi:hypothetical protein
VVAVAATLPQEPLGAAALEALELARCQPLVLAHTLSQWLALALLKPTEQTLQ